MFEIIGLPISTPGLNCTFVSASELRRGLDAERIMPRPDSEVLAVSWFESDRPTEPRVTELPAFLRDVLQEPGASVTAGLLGSCWTDGESSTSVVCCCRTDMVNIVVVSYSCVFFFFFVTFFTWLAAVLVDIEVGSRPVVLRLLFKLFMISRFLAFSANV